MGAPNPRPARAEAAGPNDRAAPGRARYFIALRPSARARRALAARAASLARRLGGRAIGEHDLHLTLAFVGDAPASIEAALRECVAALGPPGSMTFAQLGHFGPRLLWIGPDSSPPWLDSMVGALRAELERRGVTYDDRRFSPHLTLVRGARPITPQALDAARQGIESLPAGRMRLGVGASATGPNRYRWLD